MFMPAMATPKAATAPAVRRSRRREGRHHSRSTRAEKPSRIRVTVAGPTVPNSCLAKAAPSWVLTMPMSIRTGAGTTPMPRRPDAPAERTPAATSVPVPALVPVSTLMG